MVRRNAVKKPRWAAGPAGTRPQSGRERLHLAQSGPHYALIAAAAGVAAALWFLPGHVARPLILPILSSLLVLAAMLVALIAWRRPAPDARLATYWDVSAALTMAGVSAALLSEPEAVLPLLEGPQWTGDKNRN
jgi:hypothetical protein